MLTVLVSATLTLILSLIVSLLPWPMIMMMMMTMTMMMMIPSTNLPTAPAMISETRLMRVTASVVSPAASLRVLLLLLAPLLLLADVSLLVLMIDFVAESKADSSALTLSPAAPPTFVMALMPLNRLVFDLDNSSGLLANDDDDNDNNEDDDDDDNDNDDDNDDTKFDKVTNPTIDSVDTRVTSNLSNCRYLADHGSPVIRRPLLLSCGDVTSR